MREEKSSGAIVFHRSNSEPQFLLLHYGKGHWGFPKGHLEKGETEKQALLRELREETSISNANIVYGFREEIEYFFKQKGDLISKTVSFYLVESHSKKVTLSSEHSEFKWLPLKKALEQLTFENTRRILRKAHSFLKQKRLGEFQ